MEKGSGVEEVGVEAPRKEEGRLDTGVEGGRDDPAEEEEV